MSKIKKINIAKPVEISDSDLEAIADQIKKGFSSGRLDCGEGKHITWSFDAEAWED